jgi:hypothetical protein
VAVLAFLPLLLRLPAILDPPEMDDAPWRHELLVWQSEAPNPVADEPLQ